MSEEYKYICDKCATCTTTDHFNLEGLIHDECLENPKGMWIKDTRKSIPSGTVIGGQNKSASPASDCSPGELPKEFDAVAFGERLKRLRYYYHLTQREVANAIGYNSAGSVWNIEHGRWNPSAAVLYRLCKLYKCNANVLLGLKK